MGEQKRHKSPPPFPVIVVLRSINSVVIKPAYPMRKLMGLCGPR